VSRTRCAMVTCEAPCKTEANADIPQAAPRPATCAVRRAAS
jgi:hypothetical protein